MWTWKDDVSWKCSWLGTWRGGIACPMLLPIRWACRGRFGVYDDPYLIWLSGRAQCRLQSQEPDLGIYCVSRGGHWPTEGRGPGLRQIPVVLRMWRGRWSLSEEVPSRTTTWDLLLRKASIHSTVSTSTLAQSAGLAWVCRLAYNSLIQLLWFTLSNALAKTKSSHHHG